MTYDDLYKVWAEARNNPDNWFKQVRTYQDSPPAYWMNPEDMMSMLNAETPYDLYMKPNSSARRLDYPTSAFNIMRLFGKLGAPDMFLLANQEPKNKVSNIHSVRSESGTSYKDIPDNLLPYVAQAIYEHEYGHFKNPYGKNYGYMSFMGLPSKITRRELPAMRAEDTWWDKLMNQYVDNQKEKK